MSLGAATRRKKILLPDIQHAVVKRLARLVMAKSLVLVQPGQMNPPRKAAILYRKRLVNQRRRQPNVVCGECA